MNQPLFRLVLGEDAWHRLAPAIRRHYDMPPTVAATQILHGVMEEVYHAPGSNPGCSWRDSSTRWCLMPGATCRWRW